MQTKWLRRLTIVSAAVWVFSAATLNAADVPITSTDQLIRWRLFQQTGSGLMVHVGCDDGKLTAPLQARRRYLVHVLDIDAANVEKARAHLRSQGQVGRMSVDRFDGKNLPYVDNLVNLIVAEDLGAIPMEEVMRVLCPGGAVSVKRDEKWTKTVKPWPKDIDRWTHTLYDASGNAVGRDMIAGPPHHVQWIGQPRRARQHEHLASISAVVSAKGRIFSIQDEGAVASVLLPPKWFLVARDAFNGVILWKRPLTAWEGHLRPFRMGPPELARRLVAVGDRVYVTFGYGEPVSALDAASGKTLKKYEGTGGTSEILHHNGTLLLAAGDVDVQAASQAARRRGQTPPAKNRRILAVDAQSGKLLWKKADADTAQLMPNTLAADDDRVFFQNTGDVVCLESKTGAVTWRAERPVTAKRPGFSSPTLVVYNGVVFSADRAAPGMVAKEPSRRHKASWVNAPLGELVAFAADTGKRLWSCPCRECFNAPVDVLVADGLVWTGELILAGDPGITVGRDPKTGEIKRRRPADQNFFNVGMAHHRCHRNRATPRYLVLARAGVEFIDVKSGDGISHHWIRGTCQHGTLPCNGLLYVPPHSCACYTKAKLNGFLALAPKRDEGRGVSDEGRREKREEGGGRRDSRLEKGAAFGQIINHKSEIINPLEWPTYRHDAARSGFATGAVPAELKTAWQAKLGEKISSPVVAGGKVFVACVDSHAVCALDTADGKTVWRYDAGGRVDSPPTICVGRISNPSSDRDGLEIHPTAFCVFGCRDGHVYCLRASDGALVWRFRAAPVDRRIVAYGQIESAWPVHGSVLVTDGVVCFAAGRSSYLDGGIRLLRLDLTTGRKLSETVINSRDPKTDRQRKGTVRGFDLPGALPGVLAADGTSIYMRHLRFDLNGVPLAEEKAHLFSPTGLLDDSWWHRSYWIFGTRFYTGYRDWFRAGREVPGGRILVFDDSTVFGFGRTPAYYYWSTPQKYHLFAAAKNAKIIASEKKHPRVPEWGRKQIEYDWSTRIPLQARAMVLAGKTLFVAGPPEVVDEEEAYRGLGDAALQAKLAQQNEALRGGKGGTLLAVSAADGKTLAQIPLHSPPAWDGMAAAGGRLYLSTLDGTVVCFGGK